MNTKAATGPWKASGGFVGPSVKVFPQVRIQATHLATHYTMGTLFAPVVCMESARAACMSRQDCRASGGLLWIVQGSAIALGETIVVLEGLMKKLLVQNAVLDQARRRQKALGGMITCSPLRRGLQ